MIKTFASRLLLHSLIGLWIASMIVSQSHAAVTFELQVGIARDSSGAAVADGTLWALLVDTDNDGDFTGFAVGSYLSTPAAADQYFTPNQSLSLNQVIGGDTIFAMGGFSTGGVAQAMLENLEYTEYGTAAGRRFAFLWFPGAVYTGGASASIGSQVGGINSVANNDSLYAMILPDDEFNAEYVLGVASDDDPAPDSRFYAVNLTAIPEPSSALLAMLGGLGLVFCRRRVA